MATYLVVMGDTEFPADALGRLEAAFADNFRVTDNTVAIRSTTTTTDEIRDTVLPEDEQGRGPRCLITRFDGYSGYHLPAMWEWLTKKSDDG